MTQVTVRLRGSGRNVKKTSILSLVFALASILILVTDSARMLVPLALASLALIVFALGSEITKDLR